MTLSSYKINTYPTITPIHSLVIALLFTLLVQGAAIYLRMQQPWLGLQVSLAHSNGQLLVATVTKQSPADANIPIGKLLLAVETTSATSIPLKPLIRTEPFSVPSYQMYADYQTLHRALYEAIHEAAHAQQTIKLVMHDGQQLKITPLPETPLSGIPSVFWWLLLSNLIAPLLGAIVWTYKPYTLESACLVLACMSFFCFQTIFALVISRELHIPPEFFALLPVQAGLLNLFTLSLYIILCYYPNRLMPMWAIYPGIAVAVLLSLNYQFHWLEIPLQAFLFQYVPIILLGTWLMHCQWIAAKGNPVDRTTVLMLQLSAMLPCWLIMLLYIFPIALGSTPLIHPIANRLLLFFIFAGWVVGVLRFRLFDIEYWWFKSLLWLLGGSLVVILECVVTRF